MTELLPCQFCGGEADVHYFAHDDSECTVMCSNPNCRASVSARSCGSMTTAYNRARKLWNSRAERTCRMEYNEEWSGDELYPTECYNCSECHYMTSDGMPSYCPNCGARVEEES